MSKHGVLSARCFVVFILCVILSTSILPMASVAAGPEANQLNSGRRNTLIEPGEYRFTVPGRADPFRTDADMPWVFCFEDENGKRSESVLNVYIAPIEKGMDSFFGNWEASSQGLAREAHDAYGEIVKELSFSSVPDSNIYAMHMELQNEDDALEVSVYWRLEQSYWIEFWGFNEGNVPEMDTIARLSTQSFQDLTTAPASPVKSTGYFTPSGIFKPLSGQIEWFLPLKADEKTSLRISGDANAVAGKPEAAIKAYTEAIQLDPKNDMLYNQRAVVYSNIGQDHKAVEDYDKAIELAPDCAFYYRERAVSFKNMNKLEQALADCDMAIKLDSGNYEYYNLRASVYLEMENYGETIKDSNKSINRNPDYPSNYYRRGVSHYRLGDYKTALEDFENDSKLDPDNFANYSWIGGALGNLGRYREGIDAYTKAIELKPDSAEDHHNRANLHFKLGEYELAFEGFTDAIKLTPDSAHSHNGLGATLIKLGRYHEAVEECSKAIRLEQGNEAGPDKPSLAIFYGERGLAYYLMNDNENALSDYAKAIETDPTVHYFYSNRALVYSRQGKHTEAIEENTVALSLNKDPIVYFNRGIEFYNLKKYEEAVADFTKAIEHNPNRAEYYMWRASAYYNLGEYEKAEADEMKAYSLGY